VVIYRQFGKKQTNRSVEQAWNDSPFFAHQGDNGNEFLKPVIFGIQNAYSILRKKHSYALPQQDHREEQKLEILRCALGKRAMSRVERSATWQPPAELPLK
jgi:hypothetical protein